jgi:hypothetical protein
MHPASVERWTMLHSIALLGSASLAQKFAADPNPELSQFILHIHNRLSEARSKFMFSSSVRAPKQPQPK